jgi:hypothetical protein
LLRPVFLSGATLDATFRAGSGNEIIAVLLESPERKIFPFPVDSVHVSVLGGAGRDQLTLLTDAFFSHLGAGDLLVDGRDGFATATVTPNVSAMNCQAVTILPFLRKA